MPGRTKNGTEHRFVKQWAIALAGSDLPPMTKLTGTVIREHVDVRTRTVYIGVPKLAELTGWDTRSVEKRRSELRDSGWLVDTGERHGRAIVWRLVIPNVTPVSSTGVENKVTPVESTGIEDGVTPVEVTGVAEVGTPVSSDADPGRFEQSTPVVLDTDPGKIAGTNLQREPTKREPTNLEPTKGRHPLCEFEEHDDFVRDFGSCPECYVKESS